MRKILKSRKAALPRAAALLIIIAVLFCFPAAGMCKMEEKTAVRNVAGTVITTTYETELGNGEIAVETNSQTLAADTQTAAVPKDVVIETNGRVYGLEPSVRAALAHMGLKESNLEVWSNENPRSTLKNLKAMPPAQQRKVANVATFIRQINKQVSPKVAWREACAMVYYCHKYRVPTDLVVGVAKAESRFQPNCVSRSGAMGVMQVMWKIHYGMLSKKGIATKQEHMFDPERGVEAGVMLLSRFLSTYGSIQQAINRYAGCIAVAYLQRVNQNIAMLQAHSNQTGF